MPGTIEERVAYLEGKPEEHSRAWVDIKNSITHLDQRITFLDQKVDRFRDELSGRIVSLDQKISKFAIWIIGIQVTAFMAMIVVFLRTAGSR